MSNPLAELAKAGQSVWYDQMERKLVSTGKLQKMIEQDDLRGLTSNPTIFEKSIAGSADYDDQLKALVAQNKNIDEIYEEMVVADIGNAADAFLPVYQKTKGLDGYVSLEVSPLLARKTAETIAEAKKLFGRLNKKNLMIKIPGTPEGLPAIEEAIAAGINVNVTLIFNNDQYTNVIDAYMKGLERRVAAGQPIGDISSVASFFVSRIDAAAEKLIDAKMGSADEKTKKELESMKGKIAIANAKTAYELFKKSFASDRFKKLEAKGARKQRPLWASTGTKSKAYSDVMYPEALIGPDTVDTMPPGTYDAFRDHGKVRASLEEGMPEAHAVLKKFADHGFSLKDLTEQLTADGVKSFEQSFVSLMNVIETRHKAALLAPASRTAPAATA
jgi:transaldolase/glucose-6-phosphate isomerase